MRIGQINLLTPENNLNNLMNFTSKNINVKDLGITIGGRELSYNQYWEAKYGGNAIEDNANGFAPNRIREFNRQLDGQVIASLLDQGITAQAINIRYRDTTFGSTHFEAQILYLFKELYNIFGGEVFPNNTHFARIENDSLRAHITTIKDCLESILFLYWSGDDAMKILVKQAITAGVYDLCPQGFTKNIETALSKLIADSEVSAKKFFHLEGFIKASLVEENNKPYGPNQLSRGFGMDTHDAKSVLKQLSIDFKLSLPIVRDLEWIGEKFNRFVEKVKKAHPFIKNNIKQIPDEIIEYIINERITGGDVDAKHAFKKYVQHKTNFFYWEDCFDSCVNIMTGELQDEKLKFFLKINMAGSGFIDHFAYKFSHGRTDYLYVKGYNIDEDSNLTIQEGSGVIVSYDVVSRNLLTHASTQITINSIAEFSTDHGGFAIDAVDFTELFLSRRGDDDDAIREYYDLGFLANIEAPRFAGCTEQELQNTFADKIAALRTINSFIGVIQANPEIGQVLNNHFASTLIYLAHRYRVDISKLNISSPIMNDPEWVRNIDPLQEPLMIQEIDFGVPNNGVAINQILADVAPVDLAIVDPHMLNAQMHLRQLEDFRFYHDLLNNPDLIALRNNLENEPGQAQLTHVRNFLEAHAHLRDEAMAMLNAPVNHFVDFGHVPPPPPAHGGFQWHEGPANAPANNFGAVGLRFFAHVPHHAPVHAGGHAAALGAPGGLGRGHVGGVGGGAGAPFPIVSSTSGTAPKAGKAKDLSSHIATKLSKESKDVVDNFDSQYLADYVNNKLAIQVAQIKGSYVGNDLKQHLAQEVAEDHQSTSSNSNSWDKFDEAVLAGHFGLEIGN